MTNATSLRSYKFVKTAPHKYTGNASIGIAVLTTLTWSTGPGWGTGGRRG